MKQLIWIVFMFSVIGGVSANPIDSTILSLPIKTLDGSVITLSDYKGKQAVYLKFWATWCQPCRKQMPHFEKVQKQYGKQLKVIAINLGVNDSQQLVKDTKNEFGLSMSIAIDTSGALAQAFGIIGTPFHILIDKKANIIHKGFDVSTELDNKLKIVSKNKSVKLNNESHKTPKVKQVTTILNNIETDNTVLFFVATWCDWYLKESRPAISKQCVNAQKAINILYRKFPNYNWIGVVSRLWTGENELNKYIKKYTIKHPVAIDTENKVFYQYGVKNFPTLIVLHQGKEVLRLTNFNKRKDLITELKQYY
ncbi:hypothetical protein MNBD_GAMMA22-2095 [hydrothermal vent metagenome]|uniref:Thioredoxin domain-containing protein n=1 Tax=hydrothermal vent metagenome TaxID=652676 RepID=A0A3B1B5Z4_9ZZZZ